MDRTDLNNQTLATDIRRFTEQVEHYLRTCAVVDQNMEQTAPEKISRKSSGNSEMDAWSRIREDASVIRSRATASVNNLVNFHIGRNGDTGKNSGAAQLRTLYFRKLKKQQMELLSAITDEVDIIRGMIRQYRDMQAVLKKHSVTIHTASGFMEMMRERMERRPTTLLRLQSPGKKAASLNQAIDEMQDYEDTHARDIREEAERSPVGDAYTDYLDLTQNICMDIRERQERVLAHAGELKQGGGFLLKLVSGGYSPFIKRKIETLVVHHDQRIIRFRQQVLQARQEQGLTAENI